MSGFTLDAGALIAVERNDRRVVSLIHRALTRGLGIAVPAGVIGQVWRDGARQVRIARLLRSSAVVIETLDGHRARAAGQLCGATGTHDVIDATVALCARSNKHSVLTSDPRDILRLDPTLKVERC